MSEYIESFLTKETHQEIEGKSFAPRAAAYFVDFLLLYGINVATAYGIGTVFGLLMLIVTYITGVDYYFDETENRIANWVVGITLSITYFALFEWLYGATGGKVITKMRVIDINGSACTLKQTLVRSVYRLFDGLFLGAVGYSAMKAPLYQRYGDQKSNTIVVSSKSITFKAPKPWWWFVIALVIYASMAGILQLLIAFLNIHFV